MPSASAVAKYLLALADDEAGDLVSNLKLQKLLYYAQGFHLALHDAPLFPEEVLAWEHGPVVEQVWREYRNYGAAAIPKPDVVPVNELTDEQKDLINEVYTVYGQFSAWKLRNMTHMEAPWAETARNFAIPNVRLTEYFKTQLQ